MCRAFPCRSQPSSGLVPAVGLLIAAAVAGPVAAHVVASVLPGLLVLAAIVVVAGFALIAYVVVSERRNRRDEQQNEPLAVPGQLVVVSESWQRTVIVQNGSLSVPVHSRQTQRALPPVPVAVPLSAAQLGQAQLGTAVPRREWF